MDYCRLYTALINTCIAKGRVKSVGNYYERHHIKPKSLFPEEAKDKSNIALLTPREHYLAHWLLTKIYPTKEMFYAFFTMCNRVSNSTFERSYRVPSKVYEKARLNFAKNNPAKTDIAREKISKIKKGEKHHFYGIKGEKSPNYNHTNYSFTHSNGATFFGTPYDLIKTYNLNPSKVSDVVNNHRQRTGGWKLSSTVIKPIKKGSEAPSANHTFFCWYKPSTGEGFVGSRHDFANFTKFKPKSIHTIISKDRNSLFGWIVNNFT